MYPLALYSLISLLLTHSLTLVLSLSFFLILFLSLCYALSHFLFLSLFRFNSVSVLSLSLPGKALSLIWPMASPEAELETLTYSIQNHLSFSLHWHKRQETERKARDRGLEQILCSSECFHFYTLLFCPCLCAVRQYTFDTTQDMQLFFASVSHCVTLFNTGWVNKYLTMIMFGTSSTESWSYWIPSNGHSVETQDHCVIITYLSSMTIYHPITFYSLGAHLMLLKLSPLGCRTGNTHCSRACAFTDTAVLSPSNWINGCSLPPQAILTVHIESNFVFPSL